MNAPATISDVIDKEEVATRVPMETVEKIIALLQEANLARMQLARELADCRIDARRFRWLQDEATAAQWERASHAADSGAEIDQMRVE